MVDIWLGVWRVRKRALLLKWGRVREEPTEVLKRISRLNEADWEREPAAALTFDKGCPSLVIILRFALQ